MTACQRRLHVMSLLGKRMPAGWQPATNADFSFFSVFSFFFTLLLLRWPHVKQEPRGDLRALAETAELGSRALLPTTPVPGD